MATIERLEEFRRHLQSRIARRQYLMSLLWSPDPEYEVPVPAKELATVVAPYEKIQRIEKRLLAYITEQQRAIYDFEKELDSYHKYMLKMEEQDE